MKCSVSTMETLDVFELFECKDKQKICFCQIFSVTLHKNNENGKSNTVFRRSKPHQTLWSRG